MKNEAFIARTSGWVSAWVGEELVLMHGDSGAYLSVSETGGRIWEMISEPICIEDLSAKAAIEYGTMKEQVQAEVSAFLEQLLEEDAIHVSQPRAA